MCVHLRLSCFFTEQFRRHDSLHNNEAASPLYVSEPQYHPRNWSSWQNTTREVSALEYSGKIIMFLLLL